MFYSRIFNPELMEEDFPQVEGEFFKKVQSSNMFSDSKTFVDSVLMTTPNEVLKDFEEKGLEIAVKNNFRITENESISIEDRSSIETYIDSLWESLERKTSGEGTLIPLKNNYIVPGGRFRELYYWDSYFTMLGLEISGKDKLLKGMIDNFSSLIDRYGFIPNGNRVYYLDRSQPPFFARMLTLISEEERKQYHEPLKKEYDFWMNKRSIETPEGDILNRYYSDENGPRPESYKEDIESGTGKKFYRDVRTACESGWDFSSRWMRKGNFNSISTSKIIPVDLNCYLYFHEKILSETATGDSARFQEKRNEREKMINKYFWDEEKGFYFDYNYEEQKNTDTWSLAGGIPLYTGVASDRQAEMVARNLEEKFLKEGGFVTTLRESGNQWDYPNGWPPLQWMIIEGLKNYGFYDIAEKAASRWVKMNREVFEETGKMFEKYNVVDRSSNVEDGEYTMQEGFGWTNGVFLALSKELD